MPQQTVKLRPYQSADEQPALALWQRSWQQTYPQIDFSKRVDWFREHWSDLQLNSKVVVAEYDNAPDHLAGPDDVVHRARGPVVPLLHLKFPERPAPTDNREE